MSYRTSKCRFLTEYANFKKNYYKEHSKDGSYNQEYAGRAVNKIDNIVRNANRGLITLDEAMKSIADV